MIIIVILIIIIIIIIIIIFTIIIIAYSNIQQFLKLHHVLMYLCALSDGKNGMDLESYFNINILVK